MGWLFSNLCYCLFCPFLACLRFDEKVCLENESGSHMTSCLGLHPTEPLIVVADETDRLVQRRDRKHETEERRTKQKALWSAICPPSPSTCCRVTIFRVSSGERVRRFRNGNHQGSRVTALQFINPHERCLLMAGASDGTVRYNREGKKDM